MMPRLIACLLILLCTTSTAAAQWFAPAQNIRNVHTLSMSVSPVLFEHDSPVEGGSPILYEGTLLGLNQTSSNHMIAAYYGAQPAGAGQVEGANFLDVTAMLWGQWFPVEGLSEGRTRAFMPIALFLNYRRVQGPIAEDAPERTIRTLEFDVFALGLGAGVGFDQIVGERVLVRGRAIPVLGISDRRMIAGAFMSDPTYLIDADLDLHIGRVFGGTGISVGYGFRAQAWRLGGLAFAGADADETIVYNGTQHHLRLGINW